MRPAIPASLALTVLAVFCLSLISSFSIQASPSVQIHSDEGRMPRCLSKTDSPEDGLLFVWDSMNHYRREIWAIPLAQIRGSRGKTCENWMALSRRAGKSSALIQIESKSQTVFGYSLSAEVQQALGQVRAGGDVFHPEKTAKEWLRVHPVEDFTFQKNREMSEQLGMSFTLQVYERLLVTRPANAQYLKQTRNRVAMLNHAQNGQKLRKLFGSRKITLVQGFMSSYEEGSLPLVQKDFRTVGIDSEFIMTDTIGSVERNAEIIEAALRKQLERGDHIILLATSKGAAELLYALTELAPVIDGNQYPGRIEAVQLLSPAIRGSLLVDWALRFPTKYLAKWMVRHETFKSGLPYTGFAGFHDMGSAFLSDWLEPRLNRLPQSIAYFNVFGIPLDGVAPDPGLARIQNRIYRPKLWHHGSNDGLIEFPGTALPDRAVPDYQELIVDASHSILDGRFDGLDLSKDEGRRQFLLAVMWANLDHLEKKKSGRF